MKKLTFWKSLFLLCALIVGSSSVWGAEGDTHDFEQSINQGLNNGAKPSNIQIAAQTYPVKEVIITYAYNKSNDVRAAVSVNGTSWGDQKFSSTSNLTTYSTLSFTGAAVKGAIVISFANNKTASSGMGTLKVTNVRLVEGSTASVINASDVEITADDTSGEIPFTISNPVANTHLTATITTGDTWLSNATVDEDNGKVTFTSTVNEDMENSREGTIHLVYGDNLASKDITITQAAMPAKYSVTYTSAQENGTLTIKKGNDVVASGASFPVGTELTIVATPDENYAVRNWQYRREGGSWVTNTTATTYTMTDKNVEFRANFDPTLPVNFSVNGQIASTARFANGKKITFPESVTSFGGYMFMGWAETAIDGSATVKPTLVDTSNETMGTEEQTYYAVYAKTTALKATFDSNDITDTPLTDDLTWTHTDSGIELYLTAGQLYTGSPKTFTTTASTSTESNYMEIRRDDAMLRKVIVTTTSGTYKPNKWALYEKVEDTSGTTVTSSVISSTPVYTLNITGSYESLACFASTSNQIRATKVEVEAEALNNDYRTTLTQPITVGDSKYASYCSTSALDFTNSEVKAYKAKVDEEKVVLTQVDKVPANTGIVVYGATGDFEIPVIATAAAVTENEMVGVTVRTKVVWNPSTDVYNYILQQGQFNKANDGYLKANRAYLSTSYNVAATGARPLTIVFEGETTGINGVEEIAPTNMKNRKVVKNGRLVIETANGEFTIDGARMK